MPTDGGSPGMRSHSMGEEAIQSQVIHINTTAVTLTLNTVFGMITMKALVCTILLKKEIIFVGMIPSPVQLLRILDGELSFEMIIPIRTNGPIFLRKVGVHFQIQKGYSTCLRQLSMQIKILTAGLILIVCSRDSTTSRVQKEVL